MRTHFEWSRILPLIVVFSLALAAISPTVVQAEGDVPEAPPLLEPAATQPEEPGESPVTAAVQVLAEAGAELVGADGAIPLASQSALTILCAPDPWFYGACTDGKCHYDRLDVALADWGAKKGYGMIYLEGNYNQDLSIFENISIDSTLPGYLTLKGITRDYLTDGAAPVIQGTITVFDIPAGFTLQGISVKANTLNYGIDLEDNKGLLKLVDLNVTNTNGPGAYIYHKGSVEMLRVDVSTNEDDGMYLLTCDWGDWESCTVSGTMKITDSAFNSNGNDTGLYAGLWLRTRNPITINGLSAIGNKGDGLDIEAFGGGVTIKNAVFMNTSVPDVTNKEVYGYGLWLSEESFSNVTLENVAATGNANDGLFIGTSGTVTLKNVAAYSNGKGGLRIAADIFDPIVPAARSVNITNSAFFDNPWDNLVISALGPITLTNVNAYSSTNGNGAYLDNSASLLPAPVTVTNGVFHNNEIAGLEVYSRGNITLNTITASINNSYGVYLDNNIAGATGGITMLAAYGVNTIHSNGDDGLQINTTRNITLNKLTVSGSSEDGINVDNAGLTTNLLLNDVSSKYNYGWGIAAEVGGTITWNRGGAWDNGQDPLQEGGGAELRNSFSGLPKNITLKDVVFDGNLGDHGLSLETLGSITLTNISASGNTGGAGINFEAPFGKGGNFTILRTRPDGYNTINGNGSYGIYIFTKGNITLNRVQANENGNMNAYMDACQGFSVCTGTGTVTVMGTTNFPVQFNSSEDEGLFINASGNVKLSGVQVNQNALHGLTAISVNGSVSVMGAGNQFNGNGTDFSFSGGGALLRAKGNITLMNFLAEENDWIGIRLDNTSGIGNVTVTATVPYFDNRVYNNTDRGIEIFSNGIVLVSKVIVEENEKGGLFIMNETASLPKPVSVISSSFIRNQVDEGLYISSKGAITLNMVTAEWNGSHGAYIGNNYQSVTALPITVTKSNFSHNNEDGLQINASGNIVLNTVTALNNYDFGAHVLNHYSPGTGSVSVIGKNTFASNGLFGLHVESNGLVSITGTDASFNEQYGILIDTEKAVTLINTMALNNDWEGVVIATKANVTINNLASFSNGRLSPVYNFGSGLLVLIDGGKVYLKNSSFIANEGYGFEVYVNNPSLDFFMSLVNYMGNIGGTYLVTTPP